MVHPSDIILPPSFADLKNALDQVNLAPLECDGFTLLICSALHKQNIPFTRMLGYVESPLTGHVVEPHMWVEIDGWIIDYRLQMWVPKYVAEQEIIPHGIFSYNVAEDMGFNYHGDPTGFNYLPDVVLDFMSDGFYSKLKIPASLRETTF
jgi:hypothetical protein